MLLPKRVKYRRVQRGRMTGRVEGLRAVVRHVRQVDRQLLVGKQVRGAVLAVDDREQVCSMQECTVCCYTRCL